MAIPTIILSAMTCMHSKRHDYGIKHQISSCHIADVGASWDLDPRLPLDWQNSLLWLGAPQLIRAPNSVGLRYIPAGETFNQLVELSVMRYYGALPWLQTPITDGAPGYRIPCCAPAVGSFKHWCEYQPPTAVLVAPSCRVTPCAAGLGVPSVIRAISSRGRGGGAHFASVAGRSISWLGLPAQEAHCAPPSGKPNQLTSTPGLWST